MTTIKVTETQTAQEYRNGEANGSANTVTTSGYPKTYIVAKTFGGLDKTEDLIDSNVIGTATIDSIPMDAAKNMDSNTTLSERTLSISSEVPSALHLASDPLEVSISEDLDSSGVITLTVTNKNGDYHFTQKLVFTMDKTENSLTPETSILTSESSVSGGDLVYTVTTTKKTYETATYSWTLTSVETISEPVPTPGS